MNTNLLGTYVNGNTIVAMYNDGTKVHYIKDGETPAPEYPESMDLKITNCCDLGCPMCAELSSPDGRHALLDTPLIESIQPYTELAIGGGNPLSHPQLGDFLHYMDCRNVICNLTVNAVHFMQNIGLIGNYAEHGLIHGLGVSVPEHIPDGLLDNLKMFPNAVVHTIAGATPWSVYESLADHDLNLLVLGFKFKGKGKEYAKNHWMRDRWFYLSDCIDDMRQHFKAIAFDNLAVEQLGIRDIFPDEFSELYMGDDSEFTMYIDLVAGKYGKSSTHKLREIDADTVPELFQKLKDPLSETD